MKWLEVIHIRTGGNNAQRLVGELTKMLAELKREAEIPKISLYRHSVLPSEFSLYLNHLSENTPPEKSQTGLRLVSSLRELGMINHTIWVMEKDNT